MNELIENFFSSFYTEEMQAQLYRSLGLFTVYGLTNIHQELPDIIMQEGEDHREVIADKVLNLINSGLDDLLQIQRIRLVEGAPLAFKATFLEAIYTFAYREDYLPYKRIVENWSLNNEEKLATILADIISVDVGVIMEYLDWVYDGTMKRMVDFINEKATEEDQAQDMELLRKIRRSLKAYEASFGTPASVQSLIDLNMSLGSPLQVYLELFKESVVNLADLESTTFNLIWLALISSDATDNPQKFLLEISNDLFSDMHQIQVFSSMLQKAMGRYQEFKEHQQ